MPSLKLQKIHWARTFGGEACSYGASSACTKYSAEPKLSLFSLAAWTHHLMNRSLSAGLAAL
jgi:hypothetical protein